jgi:hypothetical protein
VTESFGIRFFRIVYQYDAALTQGIKGHASKVDVDQGLLLI